MKRLLGTKDKKRVYGSYTAKSCGLPKLTINKKTFTGSSLGPANYTCKPNKQDVEYWKHLAKENGLID